MKKPSLAKAAKSASDARRLKGRRPDDQACVIDIDRFRPDPTQPREFFDDIKNLADSLAKHGQLQPITARWVPAEGLYEIVAGERRYRAARMAGLKTLRAIVVNEDGRLQDGDKLELQLVENAHRADVLPLEHAAGVRRLMELKRLNAAQVAERLQTGKGNVTKLLAVLDLDERIRNHVNNGELSMSAAYEISKLPDLKDQLALTDRAVKTKLTRDEVSRLVLAKKAGTWSGPAAVTIAPVPPPTETPRETKPEHQTPHGPPVETDVRPAPAEPAPRTRTAKQPSPVVSERANTGPLKDTDYTSPNGWRVVLTSERSADFRAIARFFHSLANKIETGVISGSERVRPANPLPPEFDYCVLHKPRAKRSA